MKLENRADLQQLREALAKSYASETQKVIICAGTGCVAGGSLQIHARLKELLEALHVNVSVELEVDPHDDTVGLKKSGCHGFCEMGPPSPYRSPGMALHQGKA